MWSFSGFPPRRARGEQLVDDSRTYEPESLAGFVQYVGGKVPQALDVCAVQRARRPNGE
jgi:hypothetical protein